jgi:two-component system chemotaxis response regulator CheY
MKPARVLIVDDSSVMRKIVGRSLRQAGLEIVELLEASNGSEALSLAKENPLDLILSDINMPVMDGLEFVRQLRCIESAKHIPVIMITTEAGEAHVVEALSLGASGYIRKPFTPEQIKERVISLVGG